MRKRRFSEDRIIGVLREQAAGATIEEVCWRPGISTPTLDKWKAALRRPGRIARGAPTEGARGCEPAAEEAGSPRRCSLNLVARS